ncbi:HAD hydrolase-like protein [Burkholderia vietnamiensis]|uniref:HAD hydrolase-like protein n=1 Tax=Burkholderia vietnamiensis TaxID=60552 RepID=UPI003855A863
MSGAPLALDGQPAGREDGGSASGRHVRSQHRAASLRCSILSHLAFPARSSAPPPRMTLRLALFDFDGTLADSYPVFADSLNGLAARHGFRQTADGDQRKLRGLSASEVGV